MRDTTGQPKVVTIAPPIQIFHPVFQEFLDRINDPKFEPDEEVAAQVVHLMSHSSHIYHLEAAALPELRKILTDLLGGYMAQAISGGSRNPDGTIFRNEERRNIPLFLLEYKRAIGEGGCDPSIQAAFSLREFIIKPEVRAFRILCAFNPRIFDGPQLSDLLDECGCPSFILAGGGPNLSILGAFHNDKYIVQPLTTLYMGEASTYENTHAHHIAKVFTSLRRARHTLDQHYKRISEQATTPTNPKNPGQLGRRCFFPYPTKFKEYQAGAGTEPQLTEFEYTDVPDAHPTNVTFFAQVKLSKRKLVVKFVDRYGVEAHELLAKEGMAPQLLYCGTLDGRNDVRNGGSHAQGRMSFGLYVGPLRMVVMDYVEAQKRDDWPANAREQAQEAIKKLHDEGFVFGDLRPPNVLFLGRRVFLIDFDWAGKKGKARYPMGYREMSTGQQTWRLWR